MKVTGNIEFRSLLELISWHHCMKWSYTTKDIDSISKWLEKLQRLAPLAEAELQQQQYCYMSKELQKFQKTVLEDNCKKIKGLELHCMAVDVMIIKHINKPHPPQMKVIDDTELYLAALVRYMTNNPVTTKDRKSRLYNYYREWANYFTSNNISGMDISQKKVDELIEQAKAFTG